MSRKRDRAPVETRAFGTYRAFSTRESEIGACSSFPSTAGDWLVSRTLTYVDPPARPHKCAYCGTHTFIKPAPGDTYRCGACGAPLSLD